MSLRGTICNRQQRILRGNHMRSRELLSILERTISLIDDLPETPTRPPGNVLDFVQFKSRQLPDI